MKWIKTNIFSIISLCGILYGVVVLWGNIPNRVLALEDKTVLIQNKLNQMELNNSNFNLTNSVDHTRIQQQLDNIDRNVKKIIDNFIDKAMK